MTKYLIGASVAAWLAIPALAFYGGGHGDAKGPQTRAQVQAKVQEHFAKIDADKDGAVTQAEFDAHHAARKAEWQSKRAERRAEIFAQLDTDKNGQLSQDEFSAPRPERGEGEHRGHWLEHRGGKGMGGMGGGNWFARLDTNKDGRVTLAEASQQALAMFDKADANKDGTLTPEERKAAWQAMRAEWGKKRG